MENLKKKAVEMISNYFGQSTAKLYEKFYADKSEEAVLFSMGELLREHLGGTRAAEEIAQLKKQI